MLTVARFGPYRLFFYSADRSEAPHVHVARDRSCAKFWIAPVRLVSSGGFSRLEAYRIEKVVGDNVDVLLSRWNRFFEDESS